MANQTKKTESEPVAKKPGAVYVTTSFRDKDDFSKEYLEGTELADLGEARLAELVSAGVISVYQEPEK